MSALYTKYHIPYTSAYTLIEILVSLAIVGLLFGIGYVNFRDFSRRQEVADMAKKIQGDMSLAQQLALSGQKPVDAKCNDPNFLNGYDFLIISYSSPNAEYAIAADCSGGVVNNPYYKDVTLPSDISIIANSPPNPILFKVLGRGTNISQGDNVTLTLTQSYTNNTFNLRVDSGGGIQ